MSTTQDTEKYNGWTNYETWNCKLWMDNNEGDQDYWKDQAREAKEHPIENEYMTLDRRIVHALADNIKNSLKSKPRHGWATKPPSLPISSMPDSAA